MQDYQKQASDFLAKHNIRFSAVLKNEKLPSWGNKSRRENNHFLVTLKKGVRKISFDFFDSAHNFRNGINTLDSYSVLASVSCEIHCPDNVQDFCAEYGFPIDKGTKKMFNKCHKHAEKLRKFFDTEEIREELSQIN